MDINKIARKRIETLLALAKGMWDKDKKLSKRYVQLARKIGMRHQIKLGNKLFCKKCDAVYLPGKTVKVRTSAKEKMVVYVCLECGAVRKFGYAKEKRKK